MPQRILIVDDEMSIRESVAGILFDEGFESISAENAEEAFVLLEKEEVDLVLLDIWMPGMDGMEALKRIKEAHPYIPVIMISGHGTIETAVQATRSGAYDFIEKPPSYDKLILAIKNAIHLSQLQNENLFLRQKTSEKPELTGKSPVIMELKNQIERVAPTDAWVLITGEHGTGKEIVAQTIHKLSHRNHKPMIELNCAAIPEELIESELFGHVKGSFTGANSSKRGKFDLADGGMLFLDEIADMSLKTQAKILRILQEQKFERVGGDKTISVDVRVLAATNKDLEEEIRKGNFREDLYWRLNVVPIQVPPLREHLGDLPYFVEDFLNDFSTKGFGKRSFSKEAVELLSFHGWPGNVRELRNFMERVVIMSPEEVVSGEAVIKLLSLSGEDIPSGSPTIQRENNEGTKESLFMSQYCCMSFKDAKKAFEREYLVNRLRESKGNISQTAEQIGMERSNLHRKIKSLEIDEDEFTSPRE